MFTRYISTKNLIRLNYANRKKTPVIMKHPKLYTKNEKGRYYRSKKKLYDALHEIECNI